MPTNFTPFGLSDMRHFLLLAVLFAGCSNQSLHKQIGELEAKLNSEIESAKNARRESREANAKAYALELKLKAIERFPDHGTLANDYESSLITIDRLQGSLDERVPNEQVDELIFRLKMMSNAYFAAAVISIKCKILFGELRKVETVADLEMLKTLADEQVFLTEAIKWPTHLKTRNDVCGSAFKDLTFKLSVAGGIELSQRGYLNNITETFIKDIYSSEADQ